MNKIKLLSNFSSLFLQKSQLLNGEASTTHMIHVKEFKLCALADELLSLQFFKLRNVLLIVTAQVGSKRKIIRRLAQATN